MSHLLTRRRFFRREKAEKEQKLIFTLFALSFLWLVLLRVLPLGEKGIKKKMIEASQLMAQSIEAIRKCRQDEGLSIDRKSDPNLTGMIGLKTSALTTSLGNLEAKRTTTNPNFAGLMVFLFKEAGVKKGDVVAMGASSSFPSLILAANCAAEVMGLKLLALISLGSSQWGANNPDFHWIKIEDCLQREGLTSFETVAISLGGENDTGEGMAPDFRLRLRKDVEEKGMLLVDEPDFVQNVELKKRLLFQKADPKPIKAFLNIGGNTTNIGRDSSILNFEPGLLRFKRIPPKEKRGLLQEMALLGIPLIHLLNLRGLVAKYGLPWDPHPLPQPGEGRIYKLVKEKEKGFFIFSASYLFLIFLIIFLRKFKRP